MTGLRQDTQLELWEGFWADDDRFYARCTRPTGAVEWYRYEELEEVVGRPGFGPGPSTSPATPARRRTRTMILRTARHPAHRYLLGVSRPKNR